MNKSSHTKQFLLPCCECYCNAAPNPFDGYASIPRSHPRQLSSAKILLQQKEAQVIFDASEPVMVWADEFKIEEVVTNYLNNAMNHLDGEKRIEIRIEKNDKEAKVTVFNTGQNIPEEDLGKLWTKFYKVDKARTRAYGGSGIGLSIVKAIMDSHNKACGVQNVKDGVEFWFTLDCSV